MMVSWMPSQICSASYPCGGRAAAAIPDTADVPPPPLTHVLEWGEGGGAWLGPPSSQGSPMVPAEGGPNMLKLQSSWHRRRRSKILALSLKHWKGRRGGGPGGVPPPPPAVHGRSNTSLPPHTPLVPAANPRSTGALRVWWCPGGAGVGGGAAHTHCSPCGTSTTHWARLQGHRCTA